MADPTAITRNAAILGTNFAHHYYAVMRTTPEHADQFYEDSGEYQTVYEDCTAVIARTRQQVKKVLSRPMAASKLTVQSIFSVPYAGEDSNQKTTLDTGDCRIRIGNDGTPTACLKAKKQVGSTPYLPTYHNLFPNTVTDNVKTDVFIDNALFSFINYLTNHAKITISREPLLGAATDNTTTADSKANKHVRITSDKATNHETLIDNFIDSTQDGIVTENPPIIILKCESKPIEIQTPTKPSTQNSASIKVNQSLATPNLPTTTLNRLPGPSQMFTPRELSLNSHTKNNHQNFATGKSQIQILKRVPTPPEIKSSRKTLPSIIYNYNSKLGSTEKKQPVQILNPVPNTPEVPAPSEPSTSNKTSIGKHQNLALQNPSTTIVNHVPIPSEMTESREHHSNAHTQNNHLNIATGNSQVQIMKRVTSPTEIKSPRNHIPSITAYYNSPLGLAQNKPPVQIVKFVPNPPEISAPCGPQTPTKASISIHQNLATQNPFTTNCNREPIPSIKAKSRKPHSNAPSQKNHLNFATGNSTLQIKKSIPSQPVIKSLPARFEYRNTVSYHVPFSSFRPKKPVYIGPLFSTPNFPFTVNSVPHQQWANTYIQPQNVHLPPVVHRTNNVWTPKIRRG
ncbi:Hypothetical protein CINCED_3A024285 [Cinara cedri]|uniref:Nuclear transport factor 2, eukaryote,NTF2-like domain n=1 Tax=Cinara cedri TaxID=506608 RepID=A0A5E4MVT9_9HEMI|nr:Hypothetical protein CINCED_3A024285 [Cinara cedri]